jgi:hypothetical protein
MHRVRLLLPYLLQQGIQAEVLAVEAGQVAVPIDSWLAAGLPQDVPIHRVKALSLRWTKIPGLGLLSSRALSSLRKKGNLLLREGTFDLVYFSTTVFSIHVLGPEWKRRFGVPFVMDYQDPWVSDYYRSHPEVVPPGGRLKYAIVDLLHRRAEPKVLAACAGITSVSAAYPEQLSERYDTGFGLQKEAVEASNGSKVFDQTSQRVKMLRLSALNSRLPSVVLPFPGDRHDLQRVKNEDVRQSVFDPLDGFVHWVYVGRGGADMAFAMQGFFEALVGAWAQGCHGLVPREKLRLHFIGTSYAAVGRGRPSIAPLAAEYGLEGVVHENPDRIPYSETLRCLLDAHALIVPGSDDSGYTASKIYPYLLAEKPLLTIFHKQSSVVNLVDAVGGAVNVAFDSGERVSVLSRRIRRQWIDDQNFTRSVPLRTGPFAAYMADNQAKELKRFFEVCLHPNQ